MKITDSGFEFVVEQAKLLWDMFPLYDNEYRYLWFKNNDTRQSTWVTSLGGLTKAVALKTPASNVYLQLNPTNKTAGSGRPSASHVSRIQAILLDLDPIKDVTSSYVHDVLGEIESYLLGLGVAEKQIALVDSGRGGQIWILINVTADFTPRVRAFVWAISKRFADKSVKVDTSCTDLVRLARMPGSVNLKTGRVAYVIRSGKAKDCAWLFDERFEPTPTPTPPSLLINNSKLAWWRFISYLTYTAQRFITEGISEPGRHSARVACALSLVEAGVPAQIGHELLVRGMSLCSPVLTDYSEIDRIWTDAVKKIGIVAQDNASKD